MTTGLSTPDEVRKRLEGNLKRRGYLLPHQGLMAVAMPDLQDAYMVMYSALTVQQNHLSAYEREFVWLGILVAAGESIGTHHVKYFFDTGGDREQAEIVFRLVALASGTRHSFEFLDRHWAEHFAPMAAGAAYTEAVESLIAGSTVPLDLAWMTMLAIHTTLGQKWGIQQDLLAAYALRAHEGKLAESASLPMWAAGINRTIDASEVWLHLMRTGQIEASEPFRAWAEMAGQGALAVEDGVRR